MTKKEIIETINDEFKTSWDEYMKEHKEARNTTFYECKEDSYCFITARARTLALWELLEKLELR